MVQKDLSIDLRKKKKYCMLTKLSEENTSHRQNLEILKGAEITAQDTGGTHLSTDQIPCVLSSLLAG